MVIILYNLYIFFSIQYGYLANMDFILDPFYDQFFLNNLCIFDWIQ